jgi:tripartite-type tricarboxylate transporter receptor subunit TctC
MKYLTVLKSLGLAVVAATALSVAGFAASAQEYPTRPVKLVVPWAPGGNADVMARIIADRLGPALNGTVVIENRPGASGTVGTEYVARAKPDGYTLTFYGFSTHVLAGVMFDNIPYETLKAFQAISLVSTSPTILVTQKSNKITSIEDLIAAAKAAPGKLNYAHFGIGTVSQLAAEQFQLQTGTKLTAVAYANAKPIVTDMIGETVKIDMFFDSIPSSLPYVQNGQMKALGVSSLEPIPGVTNIPTIASKLPGFTFGVFAGIGAPTGTPRPIVDKLHAAIVKAMTEESVRQRYLALGAQPVTSSPEEFTKFLHEETERTKSLLNAMGVTRRSL